ncbi:transcription regulator hth lysr [Lucifera butyrica]|uniref:Transcription regulator hth lysr n=1 Tax=Lucifera butyrica TaxID=1351585 RepID=A0A498RAA4_9FIRM|nr:LysR family transcriptional regulator [Lucifera butyrica]VBB08321.1 transcription regulator hth lysr [Lucifera butyrica]VBB08393.1 transcription regulator hth lysr [Lucifera butyrica]
MEYHQLKYVLKVAEEKSFSLAAKKLYISQPSLSQVILKLEEKIGFPLFDRSSTPLKLTDIGELYIETAKKILDLSDQFTKMVDDVANLRRGHLTIGSSPFRNTYLLSQIIPIFKQRFPGLELILKEDTTHRLEELALNGQTDFSISLLPINTKLFDYEELFQEELLLALPPNHPLCIKFQRQPGDYLNPPQIKLQDVRETPFILMDKGQKLHNVFFDLCNKAEFKPRILLETQSMNAAQALVGAGMGAALLPDTLIRASNISKNPCYFSLCPMPLRTVIVAYCKSRYLSKAAVEFINLMKQSFSVKGTGLSTSPSFMENT